MYTGNTHKTCIPHRRFFSIRYQKILTLISTLSNLQSNNFTGHLAVIQAINDFLTDPNQIETGKFFKVENGGKSSKLVLLCQRSTKNSVLGTGGWTRESGDYLSIRSIHFR